MVNLDSVSISKKLFAIVGSAVMGVVLLATVFLVTEKRLIMQERQAAVRQTVEIAHTLVAHHHGLIASAQMPEEEARKGAIAAVRALRYSGNEYFFITDMQPKMVMHPIKPDLEGKELSENKDPTGKKLFMEFVSVVKANGAGSVDYLWPKPGSEQPVLKVSYVKGFEPWGWIIGSGVYVDTVNATIASRAISTAIETAVLAGVLLLLGMFIARGILRQLGGEPAVAIAVAERLAKGDLAVEIALKPGDQSSLLSGISTVRNQFGAIVRQVRQGAESVSSASSEIAQGNHDLSSRTESQASSLEETAASMEQLSATVKQNADSARQANQLAMNASTVAVKGGDVVAKVVDTMKEINGSSRKIADIISVIDGIAFQTNILALNAAVEAARAGEQGRGFAVVASEVRTLASRSADAAKEIKTLINASVERVEQGTTLVDEAGSTMTEVVSSIRRVTDIMGEISAASNEQASGVAQVGEAVTLMDQATQQNAALVEEMAAAASSLKSQAQDLVQTVSQFVLHESESRSATPAQRTGVRTGQPSPAFKGTERRSGPAATSAPKPVSRPASKPSAKPPALTSAAPAGKANGSQGDDDWETF